MDCKTDILPHRWVKPNPFTPFFNVTVNLLTCSYRSYTRGIFPRAFSPYTGMRQCIAPLGSCLALFLTVVAFFVDLVLSSLIESSFTLSWNAINPPVYGPGSSTFLPPIVEDQTLPSFLISSGTNLVVHSLSFTFV
jgi:hypothetical protein